MPAISPEKPFWVLKIVKTLYAVSLNPAGGLYVVLLQMPHLVTADSLPRTSPSKRLPASICGPLGLKLWPFRLCIIPFTLVLWSLEELTVTELKSTCLVSCNYTLCREQNTGCFVNKATQRISVVFWNENQSINSRNTLIWWGHASQTNQIKGGGWCTYSRNIFLCKAGPTPFL